MDGGGGMGEKEYMEIAWPYFENGELVWVKLRFLIGEEDYLEVRKRRVEAIWIKKCLVKGNA